MLQAVRDMALTQTVVLAHGCWDLLHLGHIRHLQAAKAMGDRLVVSVTKDEHVNKGQGRPHFTAEQRAEALRALDCVDEVVISETGMAVDSINRFRPAIYVKGIDYADGGDHPGLPDEIAAVEAVGGRFETTQTQKWSSSRLINAERFPETTLAYLASARERGFREQILAAFDRADKLHVLFVGESIKDEYVYVSPLGKPAKETILATVETDRETFHGGIAAAARHGDWAKWSIASPTMCLRKTRFVERDLTRKLFEVYSSRDLGLTERERAVFRDDLAKQAERADVIVVMDFGHGAMGTEEREIVQGAGAFLAVNTQTNAGNYGFNLITKYDRANFVCIDEPEARLAAQSQADPIEAAIWKLRFHIPTPSHVVVTRGRNGCALLGELGSAINVPPFAVSGVDTMGAGDAFLAVTAPLVAAGLELEAAAFVGNVAGAIKCSILGHSRPVERQEIVQTVEALLA